MGTLEPGENRGGSIAAGAIGASVFAISASVGFKRADSCGRFRSGSPQFFDDFPEPRLAPDRATQEDTGPARRDANLITSDELTEVLDRSVYEAIQILRPAWLRRTGFRNDLPSVIVDNQRYELDFLEGMRPQEVASMSFLTPAEATFRWGGGFPVGAIEVRTVQR
jgi:hypothetical protein